MISSYSDDLSINEDNSSVLTGMITTLSVNFDIEWREKFMGAII